MKKKIYHGSDHVIERPEYGKGMLTNDYGRGFYCTEQVELAKEWACAKNEDGYVNAYELDLKNLSILNLNSDKYSVLNWLAILTENRTYWQKGSIAEEAKLYIKNHFLIDYKKYDIMIGYRADDSFFSFAQDFVQGAISVQKLAEVMYLGELGEQIVLKSKRAFEQIKYVESEEVDSISYYSKKCRRDKEARKKYRQTRNKTADIQEIYILDIMREGMKDGDSRLL